MKMVLYKNWELKIDFYDVGEETECEPLQNPFNEKEFYFFKLAIIDMLHRFDKFNLKDLINYTDEEKNNYCFSFDGNIYDYYNQKITINLKIEDFPNTQNNEKR